MTDYDCLLIYVLELVGMVVKAFPSTTETKQKSPFPQAAVHMRGDNTAVQWVNKCSGGKEPRSGALMRVLVTTPKKNVSMVHDKTSRRVFQMDISATENKWGWS